jgi:hypothetical protein
LEGRKRVHAVHGSEGRHGNWAGMGAVPEPRSGVRTDGRMLLAVGRYRVSDRCHLSNGRVEAPWQSPADGRRRSRARGHGGLRRSTIDRRVPTSPEWLELRGGRGGLDIAWNLGHTWTRTLGHCPRYVGMAVSAEQIDVAVPFQVDAYSATSNVFPADRQRQ